MSCCLKIPRRPWCTSTIDSRKTMGDCARCRSGNRWQSTCSVRLQRIHKFCRCVSECISQWDDHCEFWQLCRGSRLARHTNNGNYGADLAGIATINSLAGLTTNNVNSRRYFCSCCGRWYFDHVCRSDFWFWKISPSKTVAPSP